MDNPSHDNSTATFSYDDLQYSYVRRYRCPHCSKIMNKIEERCPFCGKVLDTQELKDNEIKEERKTPSLPTNGTFNDFLQAVLSNLTVPMNDGSILPAMNPNMAELIRAQQGVDIDAMMQRLLISSDNLSPASDKFISSLQPSRLSSMELLQPLIVVDGLKRELYPTIADFGLNLIRSHEASSSVVVQQYKEYVASDPSEGHDIVNGEAFSNRIVLMKRGKIPFAEKARIAQKYGASALIVFQTSGGDWPYVMTDTSGSASDIKIPVLMLSAKDMDVISSVSSSASFNKMRLITRDRLLLCPICRDNFTTSSDVVRLPCSHLFCLECLVPWLKKSNSCPMCRYELPTDKPKVKEKPSSDEAMRQLHNNMFS